MSAVAAVALAVSLVSVMTACAPDPRSVTLSTPLPSASATPSPTPTPIVPTFNKAAHSIDDPTSIWVVVNKMRPLKPTNFVPDLVAANVPHIFSPTMRTEAGAALQRMFAASKAEGGETVQVQNSYRSFVLQTTIHNRFVASVGEAAADAQSARPGYSEHQTGFAVDVAAYPSKCDLAACFGETPQGLWLAANGYRFGFILRYPADKTPVTGYIYEPWHFRYVGVELATQMHDTGVTTLEEFFGLPSAPDYAP